MTDSLPAWYRHRYVWVATILLVVTAGAVALVKADNSKAEPVDLRGQIMSRMRGTLEQSSPEQHQHAGHSAPPASAAKGTGPSVICGVHVFGHEPEQATALTDVRTVYGFHMCGVAEPKRPWDVAVKLAGPVILDMSTDPPGIQVVEATVDVRFVDRLREMFPDRYAQLALTQALTEAEMADLRRRYDAAAGL
ncbi:hypothetical protein QLQ12_44085 [Actinoplanes sp. NEAU-A12]|uniref:Bypass of forespore C C-terminal domain-containing protein n=1 Tax=Actinoplanes sandaracinus TaxID=3045177 RepID=A0ABT6X0Q5_9ACTN|nr:hypothetical protein [Actinoplanes sandaracinus]MDI6105582.1 hypothetical protein [Actinoplanes sandaracinus]